MVLGSAKDTSITEGVLQQYQSGFTGVSSFTMGYQKYVIGLKLNNH